MIRININKAVLAILATLTLTTSCKFEEDKLFNEDAAQRVDSTNDAIKQILVNGSTGENHGWVMQYFVTGVDEDRFEGFNILARFSASGAVTLAGDHRYIRNGNANKYTEYTSVYEMLREKGPVLAFNTWNDLLTVFADPVDPSKAPGQLIDDGEGMAGDHNFLVMSHNENEIRLRGERHYANSRMVRCDRPWKQYLEDTKAFKNRVANSTIPNHYVIAGYDTLYFVSLYKGTPDLRKGITSNVSTAHSVVFSPNGFHLQDTAKIGDIAFQDAVLSADGKILEAVGGAVKIIPCWDHYINALPTAWDMSTNTLTAEQLSLIQQIDAEVKKHNTAWSLKSVGLGKSTSAGAVPGIVFTFYTNTAKSKTNTAGYEMPVNSTGMGRVNIHAIDNGKADNNLTAIAKKATNIIELAKSLAATFNGNYVMTPNDYFQPTSVTYNKVGTSYSFTISSTK